MKYTTPQLTHLGSLTNLTLGASTTGARDMNGRQPAPGHKGGK